MTINRQSLLTSALIGLVVLGIALQRYPSLAWIQILACLAVVALSLAAVHWRNKPEAVVFQAPEIQDHVADIAQEVSDGPAVKDVSRSVLKASAGHSRSRRLSSYANDEFIVQKHFNIYKEEPVRRDGNHFYCDIEDQSLYTLSIGDIDVEVVDGEARVTIRSQARASEMGAPIVRPVKLHA